MKTSVFGSPLAVLITAAVIAAAGANVALAVPTPIHAFGFNGNYVDSITGSVTMTAEGGAIVGGRHEFDPTPPVPATPFSLSGSHNLGLTLTNPGLSNPGVYSIEMYVRYDTVNNISTFFPDWLKLIDFKNGSESFGVYYVDAVRPIGSTTPPDTASAVRFTYAPGGPPLYADSPQLVTPGQWAHLAFTRDASNSASAYVNGDLAFTVNDALGKGVFSSPGNVMRFFQGDLPAISDPDGGPYYEVGKGGVDFLNIYNVALTAADVEALAAAVPEPSTGVLVLAISVLGAAFRRRLP